MNETWVGTIPVFGFLLLTAACWSYMLGGRSGKWKRRFVGSLFCSAAICVEALLMKCFKWPMIAVFPLTTAAFSLGYGADLVWPKIFKRLIVVAGSLVSGILMAWLIGGQAWWIIPVEVMVAATTVYLGVRNPVQAPAEEFFICMFLWAPKLMYPFAVGVIQ